MNITAFDLAQRFVGMREVPGTKDNPFIISFLKLDGEWPEHDEVPWCSAFVNYICWLLRLPRSKSLAARSWLNVGQEVAPQDAAVGFDVIVLSRGEGEQPGPDVIKAPGHVGFFAGWATPALGEGWIRDRQDIHVLGGNQSNSISVARFKQRRLLGIRRLA